MKGDFRVKMKKEILKDYPQSIIFTWHVHNGIDLVKVYQEEYGYVVDVPKYQFYGDSIAQIVYQVNVFEDRELDQEIIKMICG